MESRKKIVIYGTGRNFRDFFSERIAQRLKEEFRVIGVVDKSGNFPEEIREYFSCYRSMPDEECDYICITSTKYYDEIKIELRLQSVDENKILPVDFWIEYCGKSYFPMGLLKGKGVEIGGPSDIFQPIYYSGCICDGVNYDIETVWSDNSDTKYKWRNKVIGEQIIADATNLEVIEDETYDFVLSSNNLEHIANPIKAVKEFLRILKQDKPLIILAPCKEYTFDHRRDDTSFEHLLEDYENDILEDDLTHLSEILEKHDLTRDPLAGTKVHFKERSMNNYQNRCLHHHVFSTELFASMAEYFQLEVLENTVFSVNYYFAAIKRAHK